MNRVIRNDDQLEQAIELMRRGYLELEQNGLSMSVEFKEHKAPKTSKQHRKMSGLLIIVIVVFCLQPVYNKSSDLSQLSYKDLSYKEWKESIRNGSITLAPETIAEQQKGK